MTNDPLVIVGIVLHEQLLSRRQTDYPWAGSMALVAQLVGSALLFELVSVETIDFFGYKLSTAHSANTQVFYPYCVLMILPLVWTIYAVVVTRYALLRSAKPLFICVILAQMLGIGMFAYYATLPYQPAAWLLPVLNVRAVCGILIAVLLLFQAWQLRHEEWLKPIVVTFPVIVALIIFELITTETVDFFRTLARDSSLSLALTRQMMLAILWAVYSLPVVWYGYLIKSKGLLVTGIGIVILSVLWVAYQGMEFTPLSDFTLLANVRAGAFLLVAAGLSVQTFWLRKQHCSVPSFSVLITPFRLCIALLLFELCSVETQDYFAALPALANNLDLKATVLSVVWVIYAALLLSYGIWKTVRALRILAIILFLLAILKVGVYYLLIPNLLYRVISFAGLGVALLLASYLYQRYKSIIIQPISSDKVSLPKDFSS